jgi:hypothetical protein
VPLGKHQKLNGSIFASVVVDKKNKIASFDMIGWTDPVNPNPKNATKSIKALTHDTYVYPEELFDA